MKVCSKLYAKPGLWLDEVDEPTCGIHDIRVAIKQTAICGTDLHIYNWDAWAQKTIPVPMHVGHEFVGTVVEVGEHVKNLQIGQRVSGEGHITCGTCRNCRAGQRHHCRNTIGIGVNRPGAFAEYLVLPAANVVAIPDDISDDLASVLDPFGNAVHTALSFDLVGEDVLITGAGPVGLMAAAIARHAGARHIVITDVNPYRLKIAEKMGASLCLNPQEATLEYAMKHLGMREGFDVGMEMSGNADAFRQMLQHMNNGGNIAFLGLPSTDFAIDWSHMVFHGITIRGIYGRKIFDTWYKGMSMLQAGLDITPAITDHFPVDDFEQGFKKMNAGQAGKVILNWT